MPTDAEEFWAAYREDREPDYPGLQGMDESAQERIAELPDFQGLMVGGPIAMTDVYCLPKDTIVARIKKYISYIEDSPTDEVCQCEWIIHPDDVDLPVGKRRRKRGAEHSRCKQHTKLGFLCGFFVFTFPEPEVSTDAKDE